MDTKMRGVIIFACGTTIILQFFRIFWLIKPGFLNNARYYSRREPSRAKKLLYYLMAVTILAYTIIVNYEKRDSGLISNEV